MELKIIRDSEPENQKETEKISDVQFGDGDGTGGGDDEAVREKLYHSYDLQRGLKTSLLRLGMQIKLSRILVSVLSLALVFFIAFIVYGYGFVINPSKDLKTILAVIPGVLLILAYTDYAFAKILIEQIALHYETSLLEVSLTKSIKNVEMELEKCRHSDANQMQDDKD
jgi:hypothetical protein